MAKHPFSVSEASDWKRAIIRFLYKIPFLGYAFNLFIDLLRLPILIQSIKNQLIDDANSLNAKLDDVNKSLSSRASYDDTKQLMDDVSNLNAKFDDVNKTLSSQASYDDIKQLMDDVSNLNAKFDDVNKTLSSRASYDDMNDLIVRLGRKADVSKLNLLESKLNQIWKDTDSKLSAKANSSEIQELENQFYSKLDEKVNSTQAEEILQSIHQISSQLEFKANKEHCVSIAEEIKNLNTQILEQKRSLLDQQRRLSLLLEEARKRMPEPFSEKQLQTMSDEASHLLDAMYVSFEDQFRGTRAEIKERAKIYLPYVEKTGAGVSSPILDLGCGRGEWLELLTDNDKNCLGIDINRVFVSENEQRGFNVLLGDALDFLRSFNDKEIEMITSFHVIEHLEHRYLISLIDEAFRVLKPGGALILETPNPENILVGACNFYFDPTHRNPIPPALLNYLLEARGFVNTEILRLHPCPQSFLTKDGNLTQFFTASQDVAVIGFKV